MAGMSTNRVAPAEWDSRLNRNNKISICGKKWPKTLLILVIFHFLWYLTMAGFGAYFFNECPREPRILSYLIVAGISSSLLLMSSMWLTLNKREPHGKYATCQIVFAFYVVLLLFSVAWRIVGSVFIFRLHVSGDMDHNDGSSVCRPLLFWFAFVAAIVDWVFVVPVYFGLMYSPWKKYQYDSENDDEGRQGLGQGLPASGGSSNGGSSSANAQPAPAAIAPVATAPAATAPETTQEPTR